MKSKKDISALFREHKHTEIPPTPKAWRKLERKLDNHRHRGRRNVQRLMAMAAAFLLLIVFVLVLSMVVGQMNNSHPMAYNESTPFQLEDLVTTDVDFEAYRVVSFTYHHQDRMSNITEGQPDRKLVPSALTNEGARQAVITKEQKVAQLSDFNWLIGQWQNRKNGKYSVESWQRLDAQNLRGVGLVIHRRDTIFRETILLEDNGEEVILWVELAEQGRSYPFTLTKYETGTAIFSNPHMTFPQEIHLDWDRKRSLSVTYINTDVSGLDKDQSEFLKQRNDVSRQEVQRILERR